MKKIFSLLAFTLFISCKKENRKICDLENYQILLPQEWKVTPLKGLDSNVYTFVTIEGDSIFSDFGKYSQKFRDNLRVFSKDEIIKYNSMGMNTKDFITSDDAVIDQSQGTFLKEYYYYDTIDNLQAKIRIPKLYGAGKIGIHFDSIGSKNKLTIYANKLNEKEQKLLIESFKSIKFKN